MTAIYGGENGDWWKKSRIATYGWVNGSFNFSTSSQSNGKYSNAPAAYNQIPNSFQLDQLVFYIERQPDTVQTTISIGLSAGEPIRPGLSLHDG